MYLFERLQTLEIKFENTSTQAESYTWYFGDGDSSTLNSPTHIYAKEGDYDVRLTASKCGRTNDTTQSILLETTGIYNQLLGDKNWQLFPNPSTGEVCLSGEIKGLIELVIFNIKGQKIWSEPRGNLPTKVDLSELPEGLCVVNLIGSDRSYNQKKLMLMR
ncbi:MAG: PKD domain-containing protein [bacterium]|nr:PKD domain-containing protein [bacterium]